MPSSASGGPGAPDVRPGRCSPLEEPGAVLLVSCYELGHQPFAVASPWAQLEAAGFGVAGVDASLDPVEDDALRRARLVAISVPMHTAVRLGAEVARRARAVQPAAHVVMYGLYAALNAEHLLGAGLADSVVGGEFEEALVELAGRLAEGSTNGNGNGNGAAGPTVLRRLAFAVPRRDRLPPLARYAELVGPAPGERRTVGYLEASRGCLHRCLHCPITPVYDGRFFVVPREIVLADARQQVEAGARHLTFGDPDFFNGVGHSLAVARALHAAHPDVTFDVTIKVEHLLKHRERLPELAALGCVFVVSAVESLSDRVLTELDKGHTRADVREAVCLTREAGVPLRPSLVAFTPWTTLDDYLELCDFILAEGLVDHVDPVQLAIRLLVPPGSALLRGGQGLEGSAGAPPPWLGRLVPEEFGYRWAHPDPAMDLLHVEVSARVELACARDEDAGVTLAAIRELAYRAAGREAPAVPTGPRTFVPHLTEPWFCCAEPTRVQLAQVIARPAQPGGACGPPGCCS